MAAADYTHKVLTIKCCIESNTLKKTEFNIKNPSTNDWDKNLKSLLSKITRKFKFLANVDDSTWRIQIDGQIVSKQNAEKLKEILQIIPPIPVVEIVKTEIGQDCYIVTIHFEDNEFDYKLHAADDWDEDTFQDLQKAIRKEFNLDSEFGLIDAYSIDIDDIDDLEDALNDEDVENQTILHLFVKTQVQSINKFRIICGDNSFEWIPTKPDNDDEKEWGENWNVLVNEICQRYYINADDIELQQDQDGVDIDVECDELKEIWQELVDDEDNYIADIKIASGVRIFNPTAAAPDEPGKFVSKPESQIKAKEAFKSWFDNVVCLPQYFQSFVDAGYEDLNYLDGDVDEDELINDVGIKKKPHRKRILTEIQKLIKCDDYKSEIEPQASTVECSKCVIRKKFRTHSPTQLIFQSHNFF